MSSCDLIKISNHKESDEFGNVSSSERRRYRFLASRGNYVTLESGQDRLCRRTEVLNTWKLVATRFKASRSADTSSRPFSGEGLSAGIPRQSTWSEGYGSQALAASSPLPHGDGEVSRFYGSLFRGEPGRVARVDRVLLLRVAKEVDKTLVSRGVVPARRNNCGATFAKSRPSLPLPPLPYRTTSSRGLLRTLFREIVSATRLTRTLV